MAPELVLAADPGATFIARARHGETWGILIAAAGANDAPVAEVTTDDGRQFTAIITPPAVDADPAAGLAAANYWELPSAFIATLTPR